MNGGLLATPDRLFFGLHLVQGSLFEMDTTGRLLRMAEFGGGSEVTSVGGLARDAAGLLYVADPQGQRLRVFSPDLEEVGQLGYDRTPYALTGLNVIDRPGVLEDPNDVVVDARGDVYVACGEQFMRHGLQKFAPNGQHLATFHSEGNPERVFGGPRGLALAEDTIVVCDTLHHQLQRFELDGRFLGVLGEGLVAPVALAALPDGELLVAGSGHLSVLSRSGQKLREFAPRRLSSAVDVSVCGSDVWVLEREFGEIRVLRFDLAGSLLATPVASLEDLVGKVTAWLRRRLKDDGSGWHRLGALHHYVLPDSARAHRTAESCYRRALEADPESFEVRWDLADLNLKRGRREAALRLYEECLGRRPEEESVRLRLALLLRQSGQPERARAVVAEGLALKPESVLLREELDRNG